MINLWKRKILCLLWIGLWAQSAYGLEYGIEGKTEWVYYSETKEDAATVVKETGSKLKYHLRAQVGGSVNEFFDGLNDFSYRLGLRVLSNYEYQGLRNGLQQNELEAGDLEEAYLRWNFQESGHVKAGRIFIRTGTFEADYQNADQHFYSKLNRSIPAVYSYGVEMLWDGFWRLGVPPKDRQIFTLQIFGSSTDRDENYILGDASELKNFGGSWYGSLLDGLLEPRISFALFQDVTFLDINEDFGNLFAADYNDEGENYIFEKYSLGSITQVGIGGAINYPLIGRLEGEYNILNSENDTSTNYLFQYRSNPLIIVPGTRVEGGLSWYGKYISEIREVRTKQVSLTYIENGVLTTDYHYDKIVTESYDSFIGGVEYFLGEHFRFHFAFLYQTYIAFWEVDPSFGELRNTTQFNGGMKVKFDF